MSDLQLYNEISTLPDNLKREVEDFVQFLKIKHKDKNELRKREFGHFKGLITMSPDFDEPLEDFKGYM